MFFQMNCFRVIIIFFSKAFDFNVIRFFFLQAHYRNVLDISDSALKASEKGYLRLIELINRVRNL
jgi:cysteinyl-tRNA synthetase